MDKPTSSNDLTGIYPGGFTLAKPVRTAPPADQLRAAMQAAGVTEPPPELVLDGLLHRFDPSGRSGTAHASGWYVAHGDGIPAGAFGDWRTGMESTWRADIGRDLSDAEQAQHAARMRDIKAKREAELATSRAHAAQQAASLWAAGTIATDDHPYLVRKGITNPGLRIASDGRLMAPMYAGANIVSLQLIDSDGEKRFLPGGKAGGASWAIGGSIGPRHMRVYVAEGIATAQSIFEATGHPVAVAYSAGNLTAVAEQVREQTTPLCDVIIVADNDASGTGKREADKAALACAGRVIMPPSLGDANDYAQSGGDLTALLMPATAPGKYKLVSAADLISLPPVRWQIKKILPATDVAAIYGAPGAGKSFMAMDMAAAIAEGVDWCGYKTRRAHVVYIVLEAANGFGGRLKAWQISKSRDLPDTLHIIAHSPFALSNASDIAWLTQAIAAKVGPDHGGLVVFVDTLARALGDFEENSNDDMGKVIEACNTISRSLACAVVAVAHPGKDAQKGMRGGSALLGGLDTVIQLDKSDDGLRTWTIEKQKEGVDGLSGNFRLDIVTIGEDEDGDPITSAVLAICEPATAQATTSEPKALGEYRQYFEQAVMAAGRISNQTGRPFVSADAWSDYSRQRPHESDGARRVFLSRAKKALTAAGYIIETHGGYDAAPHDIFAGAFLGLD